MYIIWSLASAMSTALYLVYISGILKRHKNVHANTVLLGTHLAGGALLAVTAWLLQGLSFGAPLEVYGYVLANAMLLLLSRELYLYAYGRTDVANITIFSPLTPLVAMLTGHFMLGEALSAHEMIGTLIICGSIYFMFLRDTRGRSFPQKLVAPFRQIAFSKPVFMGFLSTIPTAFSAAFQKKALLHFDAASFTVLLMLTIALMACAIECFWRRKPLAILETRAHWWGVSGVLMAASQFIFCFVLIAAPTSVALVLQRMSVFFQVILAYVWLKEKTEIRKRMLCSLAAIGGFAFLVYHTMIPS